MSEPVPPPRALHLVVAGFPAEKLRALKQAAAEPSGPAEIFHLTEANAYEALEKIFAAEHVAVWTKLED